MGGGGPLSTVGLTAPPPLLSFTNTCSFASFQRALFLESCSLPRALWPWRIVCSSPCVRARGVHGVWNPLSGAGLVHPCLPQPSRVLSSALCQSDCGCVPPYSASLGSGHNLGSWDGALLSGESPYPSPLATPLFVHGLSLK